MHRSALLIALLIVVVSIMAAAVPEIDSDIDIEDEEDGWADDSLEESELDDLPGAIAAGNKRKATPARVATMPTPSPAAAASTWLSSSTTSCNSTLPTHTQTINNEQQ